MVLPVIYKAINTMCTIASRFKINISLDFIPIKSIRNRKKKCFV